MKKALILSLVTVAGVANAAVLDMFSTPDNISIKTGTFVTATSGAGILGGQRDIEAKVTNNPFHQDLDVKVLPAGFTVVSNGFAVESEVKLQYDGLDEAGNTGVGKVLTNGGNGTSILGGGNNKFEIAFVDNDKQVEVDVVLRKNGVVLSSGTATQPALGGASILTINMNAADMAQADSVTFAFKADASGDFGIRQINAVPEPAALAGLGLGLALMMRRKLIKK